MAPHEGMTDEADGPERHDRRRALGLGAAVAAGAWIAPAVLSLDAAAAQTGPVGPSGATIQGVVQCQGSPMGGLTVSLRQGPNLISQTTSDPQTGFYQFLNVVAGSYQVQASDGGPSPVTVADGDIAVVNPFFC